MSFAVRFARATASPATSCVSGGGAAKAAPAAQAPDPAAETAATNDPNYDEAPGLDEEGSREW